MERWMLNCGKINGRHTAQVIGTKLDELIDDLKLDDHVHIMITTDNAKSMLNATQKVSDRVGTGLGCIDHILQLIINNAVKKVPEIQTAVKRFKKLAKATHKSYHNVERIRKGCTDLNRSELDTTKHCTFIKIHNPVETRWNSLLLMIKNVIHLKPCLLSIKHDPRDIETERRSKDSTLVPVIPEERDFDLLEKMIRLLTFMEDTSELLSGDKYPTICFVVPRLTMLTSMMVSLKTKGTAYANTSTRENPAGIVNPKYLPVRQLVDIMHEDLLSRFPNAGSEVDSYAFGVLLHPKYRIVQLNIYLLGQVTIDKLVAQNEIIEPVPDPVEVNLLNEAAGGEEEDDIADEDAFFRKLTQTQNAPETDTEQDASQSLIPQSPLKTEIARYIQSKAEYPAIMHVLDWWRDHSKTYPLLAKLAKKYLAVQATSCSSERTFSTGGRTVTNSRTRLNTTNVNMMVYCKENMDKVKLRRLEIKTKEEEEAEKEAENDSNAEDED